MLYFEVIDFRYFVIASFHFFSVLSDLFSAKEVHHSSLYSAVNSELCIVHSEC